MSNEDGRGRQKRRVVAPLPDHAPAWAHRARREMVERGVGTRVAAANQGRSRDALRYWLRPGRRAWQTERRRAEAEGRARCRRCRRSFVDADGEVCRGCDCQASAYSALVALWRAGVSVKEIADELGYANPKNVRSTVAELRRRGVELERRQAIKHDRARVAELWEAGASLEEIANELETTATTVADIVGRMRREEGWDLAYRGPTGRIEVERLLELWEAGVSTAKIADEFGVTTHAVANRLCRLRRRGVRVARRGGGVRARG